MERLSAAAVRGVLDPPRPSPFSQLVYTSNDSYAIHHGDLRKIHKAAWQGQDRKLQKMMKKKKTMDLNIRDVKKRTALHLACAYGHEKVVTLLVDMKCLLDICDGENRTPLMKALQCRREACANILIDSGADPTIVDVYGNTALHYAVYSESLSMVAKLLSHGADIEVKNKAGLTPLLLAITKRSEQIVEFLLTKNANANAVNNVTCTALMLAVCHGSSEIVGRFLQQNVDIYAEDMLGMTAERYAVACGFDNIHQQLLEYMQKISKNPQNSNPEGTAEETPDQAAPLAEGTPDAAARLAEGTPDEDARLAERTSEEVKCLVEKTPEKAAPLVEGSSEKIRYLRNETSGKIEQSAEETPREIMKPVKETSEKFAWTAQGRPRKIAWPEKIKSKNTKRLERVTSYKTEVVKTGISKMSECSTEEKPSKSRTNENVNSVKSIFSKPSMENLQPTKIEKDFRLADKVKSERAAQNYVCLPGATYEKEIKIIRGKIEEPPEKPSDFEPSIEMQNSAPNKDLERKNKQTLRADQMFPSESKEGKDEKNSWDSESLPESVQQNDVCLPKATYQKEIKTINGKLEGKNHFLFNKQIDDFPWLQSPAKRQPDPSILYGEPLLRGTNKAFAWGKAAAPAGTAVLAETAPLRGALKTVIEQQEDDICIIEGAPHDETISELASVLKFYFCYYVYFIEIFINGNRFVYVFTTYSNKCSHIFVCEQQFVDKMPTSESGLKEDKKSPSDPEVNSEHASQNYMCLPQTTYQKEIKTINRKIKGKNDFVFQSPVERALGSVSRMVTYCAHLNSSAEICGTFFAQTRKFPGRGAPRSPARLFRPAQLFRPARLCRPAPLLCPAQLLCWRPGAAVLRTKYTGPGALLAGDWSHGKSPIRWFKKGTEQRTRTDFEQSVSESATQNSIYLPEATYEEEIMTIHGKLKNSPNLSKILIAVPSCKRAKELKTYHCKQLIEQIKQMKKKFRQLQEEISEAKEIKSQLENEKVKWQQELCSVRFNLKQEEKKRRNVYMLNENIREEVERIEQLRKELEVKQQIEMAHGMQDMELKPLRSNFNQVSHTHENEYDLLLENCMLEKEIAMLKLERDTLRHLKQEKENKYFEDMKILKEKNAELQMTLKQKKKTLTKRASEYSEQLKVLTAENIMLTSKLKENQDKEILKTEIESYHARLAFAIQDHDQSVASSIKQEFTFHASGDAHLQGKMNVDVNNIIYNNEMPHEPLSEVQSKSESLKMTNYAGDAVRENTLVLEHVQRDLSEIQCQIKKAKYIYKNEEGNVHTHTEQQESLEQRLLQLESKNMWLQQQLVHARKKANNKSNITINIRFLERKKQHHLLKEKNEEIFNDCNHLKERIYQYEKEKAERKVIVRQLQKKLSDLNKQCVSEASLEVTSHCHMNLQDEIQDSMKNLFQIKSQVCIKCNMPTVNL
ncbi:ankyrin repeat domain-containing protein 30A [Sapajus apella]|uniref:Ankyrin repeat domain-containing protein 30A n=1 Tax=Sapajus apella TaxID=9515 RepID=A0A6J3GDX9_SAPAP|nr:ankyrin repeat domain-containing protein 30A [Sapajus apella]